MHMRPVEPLQDSVSSPINVSEPLKDSLFPIKEISSVQNTTLTGSIIPVPELAIVDHFDRLNEPDPPDMHKKCQEVANAAQMDNARAVHSGLTGIITISMTRTNSTGNISTHTFCQ